MKTQLNDSKFNTRIEPYDWRWSATIVGIVKYFKKYNPDGIKITNDYIEFNSENITDEKYLLFVEEHFRDAMHHKKVEELLETTWEDDSKRIEMINSKISKPTDSNTIMISTFKNIKYDGTNNTDILNIIEKNRLELIKQTFKGGRSLYYNFCNEKNLLSEAGKTCRLRGYSVDIPKKGKSIAYKRDMSTFTFEDDKLFDFIPFAFSKSRESLFINCSFRIDELIKYNSGLEDFDRTEERGFISARSQVLFRTKMASSFVDFDVEIISKERLQDYFESIYIRNNSIKIFEEIDDTIQKSLAYPCPYKGEYLQIEKIVTDSILNEVKLDNLIEKLLKEGDKKYLITNLIKINNLIYFKGEDKMTEKQKSAYASAMAVREVLKESPNKIRAYEQKLISAISLKDYEKVQELILHISAYTQVKIGIALDLFEDFEKNKNLAYTFINVLGDKK